MEVACTMQDGSVYLEVVHIGWVPGSCPDVAEPGWQACLQLIYDGCAAEVEHALIVLTDL